VLLSDIQPNLELGFRRENYFRSGDIGHLRHKLAQDHATYTVPRDVVLKNYNWNAVCMETGKVYSAVDVSMKPWRVAHAGG
jgi:hypothetical protein